MSGPAVRSGRPALHAKLVVADEQAAMPGSTALTRPVTGILEPVAPTVT
ncbi:hypothetical protein [Protofrankia symbiont of Coriaria ruscifolia]|nr:hypothetical protein [Protofrankia symbiont of Coriaria ruscifolia]